MKHGRKGAKVHFASLMDICPFEECRIGGKAPKIQSLCSILQNKDRQHLKMTAAAKVMVIISRLPGCGGQAADAVPAYIQVKMEDAPTLLKIPKSECPDIWIRLPRHKWPKSWSSMEDPVVPLERNLYGHTFSRTSHGKGPFEKILLKYGWEKVSNWECLFVLP